MPISLLSPQRQPLFLIYFFQVTFSVFNPGPGIYVCPTGHIHRKGQESNWRGLTTLPRRVTARMWDSWLSEVILKEGCPQGWVFFSVSVASNTWGSFNIRGWVCLKRSRPSWGSQHLNPCAWMQVALYTLKPQAATVSAPDCCMDHPFPFAHPGLPVSCSLFWWSFSASHPLFPEDPWFLTLWLPSVSQGLFQGRSSPAPVSGLMVCLP